MFFRVVDGEVRKGDKVFFMNSKMEYEVSIYDIYVYMTVYYEYDVGVL